MPQSGTSRIERLWKTLPTAARCHLYTAGLGKQYYFDAMVYAGGVYNGSPTSANKIGDGAAPNASLGLSKDLGVYLPFGTLVHHRVRGVKTGDKSELVIILGLNQDGTGYRALRVSNDPGGSVFVSQDTKAHPALGTARSLLGQANAGLSPASASLVAQHCSQGDTFAWMGRRAVATSEIWQTRRRISRRRRWHPRHAYKPRAIPRATAAHGRISGVGHRRPFVAGLARPNPRGLRPPSQRRSPPRSRGPWRATRGRRGWPCGGGRTFLCKASRVSAFRSSRGRRPSRSSTP